MKSPETRSQTFRAFDGVPLQGTWFQGARPRYLTVIHSASAVPRGYYGRFAEWLVSRGHQVLTYDYRGIGGSRPSSLRGTDITMEDWARYDVPGAVEHAHATHPQLPVFHVGHSFGGHGLLHCDGIDRAEAVLLYGCGSGSIHFCSPPRRWARAALFGSVPAWVAAYGYVPAWAGLGVELPAGVAREWGRRCCRRDYYDVREQRFLTDRMRTRAPRVWLTGSTDDVFIRPKAIRALLALFPRDRTSLRVFAPEELGIRSLGHFAPFRPHVGRALWHAWAQWLESNRMPVLSEAEAAPATV